MWCVLSDVRHGPVSEVRGVVWAPCAVCQRSRVEDSVGASPGRGPSTGGYVPWPAPPGIAGCGWGLLVAGKHRVMGQRTLNCSQLNWGKCCIEDDWAMPGGGEKAGPAGGGEKVGPAGGGEKVGPAGGGEKVGPAGGGEKVGPAGGGEKVGPAGGGEKAGPAGGGEKVGPAGGGQWVELEATCLGCPEPAQRSVWRMREVSASVGSSLSLHAWVR